MQEFSGAVFVRGPFLLYSTFRAEHASIQNTLRSVVILMSSVEVKYRLLISLRLLFLLLLMCESIYRAQLDCEATLILGQGPSTVPMVVVGETWRGLLLRSGPASLILNFVQILAIC